MKCLLCYVQRHNVAIFFLAMTRRHGLSDDEAGAKFFILDENGLITKARKNLLELEENFYSLTTFAEDDTSMEGLGLEEVHFSNKYHILGYYYRGSHIEMDI